MIQRVNAIKNSQYKGVCSIFYRLSQKMRSQHLWLCHPRILSQSGHAEKSAGGRYSRYSQRSTKQHTRHPNLNKFQASWRLCELSVLILLRPRATEQCITTILPQDQPRSRRAWHSALSAEDCSGQKATPIWPGSGLRILCLPRRPHVQPTAHKTHESLSQSYDTLTDMYDH